MIVGWLACSIVGAASVVDGDTLYVAGNRIRLYGIDAMELDTMHGRVARAALTRIIGSDQVTCYLTGKQSHGRPIARCHTSTVPDLGAEMVKRGHALDCPHYSHGHYRTMEAPDARTRLTPAPYCGGH